MLAGCGEPAPSSPEQRTVDDVTPVFSDPTAITNPLFPVGQLSQVVRLGEEGGDPARVEVTRMPGTRVVDWEGQEIETVISQFIAYTDGEVVEVALDFFAQADDGAVWYFGEEVDNYEGGVVANHGGSWLAGRDGPPGMIMPAHPQVGDQFHPENIPGVVFEEVTVQSTTEEMAGPLGALDGGVRVEEHLMEGDIEHKVYFPGYGEFLTEAADELLTVALAVPVDARAEAPPPMLVEVRAHAVGIFDQALDRDWPALEESVAAIERDWPDVAGSAPDLLADAMDGAITTLRTALEERQVDEVRAAALDTALAASDLELQYRDASTTDLVRMTVWARRAALDASTEDAARATGDVAILETIWARVMDEQAGGAAADVAPTLAALGDAVEAADVDAATASAFSLLDVLEAVSAGD
jgi:hypothetical protein